MKKYFVYELKKSLFVMCILAVLTAAIYEVSILMSAEDILEWGSRRMPTDSIVAIGGALSVIIPIWKLEYLMKKRSVDLYYSLPLSHTCILAVKFSVGLIVLFSSFTVAYWVGSFTAMATFGALLNNVNFVLMYFAMLIPMAVIYSMTSFIFTRANRFVDGIAFVIMTGMSLGTVVEVISQFMGVYGVTLFFTPFGAMSLISWYFFGNFFKNISSAVDVSFMQWVGMITVALLGIAAAIGLFFSERVAKAENCEQLSESYFGYKTMILLYTFSLALLGTLNSYLLTVLVAGAAYAVSTLYKRTAKIGWKFGVKVGIAFIVGVGFSFMI